MTDCQECGKEIRVWFPNTYRIITRNIEELKVGCFPEHDFYHNKCLKEKEVREREEMMDDITKELREMEVSR